MIFVKYPTNIDMPLNTTKPNQTKPKLSALGVNYLQTNDC